jgi:hypothetical protein
VPIGISCTAIPQRVRLSGVLSIGAAAGFSIAAAMADQPSCFNVGVAMVGDRTAIVVRTKRGP